MRNSFESVCLPVPSGSGLNQPRATRGVVADGRFRPAFLWALLVLLWATALIIPARAEDNCSACHDQGQKLAKSTHSSLACSTCHVKHDEYPHPAKIPKPVCTDCHTQQGADYELLGPRPGR